MTASGAYELGAGVQHEQLIVKLLGEMTLSEKIGQMCQADAGLYQDSESLKTAVRAGLTGSIINKVDVHQVNELQRLAVEESRLGIPLLIGRDVIHGFKTVLPIPLGQAASWNPELVRAGAAIAAREAASAGVNWTFAPMLDISRDPRWGRIAESLGEDPLLAAQLGAAMIKGFQNEEPGSHGAIAACAKHFVGYGAAESGRDYAATNIPENELRNIYLPPFKAAVEAGVASIMTSFSDLDGIPATANEFLLRHILRCEWFFDGLVVSDWDSVRQLLVHGLTENDSQSALEAVKAGVDMEMAGNSFQNHLASLVTGGSLDNDLIDLAVGNILRIKARLGLFENPYTDAGSYPPIASADALEVAKESALQSFVLLKNDAGLLPLNPTRLRSLAVLGPLADAPYEQLGTWIFDGDPALSVTALDGIRRLVGDQLEIHYHPVLDTSRSNTLQDEAQTLKLVEDSDASVLFLGEESILSGEAHCRADIDLPGIQPQLVKKLREVGKPLIAVVMTGRPLTLTNVVDHLDALLIAWHPGTMGGAALAEILFGLQSPSGKLPVTFPRHVGQIPVYYNHKNTGKPPSDDSIVFIDDIEAQAPQTSLGMTAFHLDTGFRPLFPFGYGLSYTEFSYADICCSETELIDGDTLKISATVRNAGAVAGEEIAQLYIRDQVGSITRPVRELKGFKRLRLEPGQTEIVAFEIHTRDLAFWGRGREVNAEPGRFLAWIGGSSEAQLQTEFYLVVGD